ncbi:hypothetical protein GCM10010123_01370 [Pilimelia anulata]|uniref:Uncharacterized protein n=1 Tax=Pilimelia anulata TaxID=53371 RepID=A0A8J3F7B9_9ACTN|nr:hypothetical protein [Pilimelia anulata]GGJ75139.1 hypothetical protein GCM10010123_01370 [Pilimelia anulata]
MDQIEVNDKVMRELTLIARAAGISHAEAIALLIEEFHRTSKPDAERQRTESGIPVHAVYQGQRVDGVFNATTGGLTVTSPPLAGSWFRSPSGAAKAVVAALKPGVTPNRSGYDFWFVDSTGKTLASVRKGR